MTTYEYLGLIAAYLNLLAAYGGLGLIYHGIRTMDRNAAMRSADSERKHNETMEDIRRREEDSKRRYEEAMENIRRREEDSRRRHEESMARHDESMASLRELIDGQTESRMALRKLIERTR